ncbi:MAG: FecR family protein [Mesonia hippocampi]|uniref:FecR family protein n=1 Tax=Mesonia hippocampi TaxID=1628250 RepID=UPI003F9AFCA7
MTRKEFYTLTEKYLANTCSDKEKEQLEQLLEKLQLNTYSLDKDTTKQKLFKAITKKTKPIAPTRFWNTSWFSAAASVVVLLGLILGYQFLFTNPEPITETAGITPKQIILPDGSEVWLNRNTTLSYTLPFKNNRTIQLEGEAFFDVYRDTLHPFQVQTEKLQIQVLGTSFNVNTYKNVQPSVNVSSGKVEVTRLADMQKVVLVKNEQVKLQSRNFKPIQITANEADAWRENTIILDNTSLAETSAILENWFSVKINIPDTMVQNMTVTGKYKDAKLTEVLQSIAFLKKLKIDTLTQKRFIIRKKSI